MGYHCWFNQKLGYFGIGIIHKTMGFPNFRKPRMEFIGFYHSFFFVMNFTIYTTKLSPDSPDYSLKKMRFS